MKKYIISSLFLAGFVGSTVAQTTVFSDDFTAYSPSIPPVNPTPIFDDNSGGGRTQQWLSGGASNHNSAAGTITVGTAGSGQTRGVAYVWDPTTQPGLVAGNYTLDIAVANQFNSATFEARVFEGVRDDTFAVNSYELDLLSAQNAALTHNAIGTGSLTLLDSATWSQGAGNSGTVSLSFTYDGADDITLVMNTLASVNFEQTTTIDAVTLTLIPEPGTYALFAGLLGLGAIMIRRR